MSILFIKLIILNENNTNNLILYYEIYVICQNYIKKLNFFILYSIKNFKSR